MFFSDIHLHLLFGTDDGPKDREGMFAMVDAAYNDGTRLICATPHFCPADFGDNRAYADSAYAVLQEYCGEKYPDLKLLFGNELFYMNESVSWLRRGICRTMGDTRYVLVEFNVNDLEKNITEGLEALLNAGYIPIIAHAERYERLSMKKLRALRDNGVLVQVNAQSFLEGFSFFRKKRLKTMLAENMADFVSTDAHGISSRPPFMKECYEYIAGKYGESYAENLCFKNAYGLFFQDEPAEEER